MPKLTDAEKENIIQLYRNYPTKQVAMLAGVSTGAVYKVLTEYGVKRTYKQSAIDYKQIAIDYYHGFTDINALMKKYNCKITTIYAALDKYGVTTEERIKRANIIQAIEKIPLTGEKLSHIAKRFGVSRQRVNGIKNQLLKENK